MKIMATHISRLVILLVGLCWVFSLNAALIVYDGFDYETGQSLEGNGNQDLSWGTNRWLKHFDTSDWRVVSNSLSQTTASAH